MSGSEVEELLDELDTGHERWRIGPVVLCAPISSLRSERLTADEPIWAVTWKISLRVPPEEGLEIYKALGDMMGAVVTATLNGERARECRIDRVGFDPLRGSIDVEIGQTRAWDGA